MSSPLDGPTASRARQHARRRGPADATDTHDREAREPTGEHSAQDPRPGALWTRVAAELAVLAVVMVPILMMMRLIGDGTHMPWSDYWMMLGSLLDDTGGTDPSGLFVFQNEHPVVLAKAMYWFNARVSDGSNIELGYVVLLIAVAQIALVQALLTRSRFTFVQRSLILGLTAVLVVGMNGSWSFIKSMSGAAWLTANLFAVLGIVLRQHDRPWLAGGSAVLSAISYGTGIAAWPAIAVVGVARRPWRRWWRELPYLAGFGLTYLWYQANSHGEDRWTPSISNWLSAVGHLLEGPLRHRIWGLVVVASITAVAGGLVAAARRDRDIAPWAGLSAYGLVACVLIAYGRWIFVGEEAISRYHSLAAMFWIGASGTLICLLNRAARSPRVRTMLGTGSTSLALGAASCLLVLPLIWNTWHSAPNVPQLDESTTRQDVAAVAVRFGIATSHTLLWAGDREMVEFTVLQRRDHYPFSNRWDDDCGLLDTRLDLASMPTGAHGIVGKSNVVGLDKGLSFIVEVPDLPGVGCVLVVSPDGDVVGAGVRQRGADAGSQGSIRYEAVAKAGRPRYRAVVISDDHPRGMLLDQGFAPERP